MTLGENYAEIRSRIAEACARAGRPAESVRLLAVSKGQPPEAVDALAALGQREFGENRVQEAKVKIALCSGKLSWHLIGHLQTNKCRDAAQMFDVIHSVDSLRLAAELDKWAERAARRLTVLLEVNVAGESTKFGYAPDALRVEAEPLAALPRLQVVGLMGMAPWAVEAEKARPHFRRLRELRDELRARLGLPLPELSMGMSGDFAVAIEEGATQVRIGTALFGPRSARA